MSIESQFESIGARVRVASVRDRDEERWEPGLGRVSGRPRPVVLDVSRDRRGEFFDLVVRSDVDLGVLQAEPRDKHLLLLARFDAEKSRYLCGHDERHWFVAAVPESDPVSTVSAAKAALRPQGVGVVTRSRKDPRRRRTGAFVRQGEWFFVPAPGFVPSRLEPIRRFEPIVRSGGSTPHVAAEAVRSGGMTVYIPQIPWDPRRTDEQQERLDREFGRGVDEKRMAVLRKQNPRWRWGSMLRDPELYVRGAVRHPDHATVHLRGWHRVLMNRETEAQAMSHVVFLD
jgi:hypothetical protein